MIPEFTTTNWVDFTAYRCPRPQCSAAPGEPCRRRPAAVYEDLPFFHNDRQRLATRDHQGAWVCIGEKNHRLNDTHAYGVRCGTVAANDRERWRNGDPTRPLCSRCNEERTERPMAWWRRQAQMSERRLLAALARESDLKAEVARQRARAEVAEAQAVRVLGAMLAEELA